MCNPVTAWFRLAHDSYWLWAEASLVIGMRTMDIMTGRGSTRENVRMVSEKVQAGAELAARLASGGVTASPTRNAQIAVSHYRKRVTANRKRLSRR
ncbi:hypothetical protein NT2_10_00670 [Caenibius tardaugens NBRC 16725]|uniref:Uncharacterized protein n=1 Tax=Caenibius tardaugens NBRC 16725 TaxID=1219035 RepID=U2YPM4_9SPHN|nr:hypothetical protein [Caenibius tardaugens]AZI35809.1 hypothetical protein EGO55_07325 [Caenibius tardaugens NBRC 16725]GAD50622.1 hypothetical protein NT2_10_00670 [Caenibius tardaugens NBRC 16725]